MRADDHVIILGASVRAAAFSALRAGLRPWCADLFADLDLQAHCPVQAVAPADYPDGLLRAVREAPAGPVLYTGALENRPQLVSQLAKTRPLWGNPAAVLEQVRSPFRVAAVLRKHGLPCPEVVRMPGLNGHGRRWLLKPRRGAGGAGIRFWSEETARQSRREFYLQEYIDGDSVAALYVGDGQQAQLLGVTRQLVGESWLHAAPFHYCGSVGPLPLTQAERASFGRLGSVLAGAFKLQGLFGVDCMVRDGVSYPVEINPRYTASVEVLEYATGLATLQAQHAIFETRQPPAPRGGEPTAVVGKAIWFAPRTRSLPGQGPWLASLSRPAPVAELPAFADIPATGPPITQGSPVLTLLTRAVHPRACLDDLRSQADLLDRLWL